MDTTDLCQARTWKKVHMKNNCEAPILTEFTISFLNFLLTMQKQMHNGKLNGKTLSLKPRFFLCNCKVPERFLSQGSLFWWAQLEQYKLQRTCSFTANDKVFIYTTKMAERWQQDVFFLCTQHFGVHVHSPVSSLILIFSFSSQLVVHLHVVVLMSRTEEQSQWYCSQSFILKYSCVWMGQNKSIPTTKKEIISSPVLLCSCP